MCVQGFPSGSVFKNPPVIQETLVRSLGQEDTLEKEMATTPVFLPGKSHGQGNLEGYSPWGLQRVGHNLEAEHALMCVYNIMMALTENRQYKGGQVALPYSDELTKWKKHRGTRKVQVLINSLTL